MLPSNLRQSVMRLLSFLLIAFFFSCAFAVDPESDIIITEIMASNSGTISDEDGDYPDWIELYNRGDVSVSIKDWGLSDDESDLFKWVFPDISLEPGEFMIVWASNKDRRPDRKTSTAGVIREVYSGISGTSVDDLLSYSGFPANPDSRNVVTSYFESPTDIDDNYGQRMHGLLRAPQTGNYIFWIAGDDNSRLFLSTDETPQKAELISEVPSWTNSREWDKFPEQKSDEIHLAEGEMYYINALMKEEYGGDNLAVGWQLPDGTTELPMRASHVFSVERELHTNFAISADGEAIFLSDPDGAVVQTVDSIEISADLSYGLMEGEAEFVYFDNPTPGSANPAQGYSGISEEVPVFSHSGGFYDSDFELSITSENPDAEILYTLDGSAPDPANLNGHSYQYVNSYPSGSFLTREATTYVYEGPLLINDRSAQPFKIASINTRFSESTQLPENNIFKGTVVRAKVVEDNIISTATETNSYFVTSEGSSRYNIPVVSIVTDEKHLFDYEKGIYVAGEVANDWSHANPGSEWNDGRPANYNQRGENWEYPAHFEYFDQELQSALRQSVGIRIHGGWTRAYNMKSLRLYARKDYDSDNTLNYPFFGELPSRGNPEKMVTSFRRLILRNSGNDNYQTMYRDALMQDLVKHLPFAVQAWQPVVHFVNGEYWGVINIRERYDEDYVASHYHMDTDDVVILDAWGNVDEGNNGDNHLFFEIVDFAEANNLSAEANFNWVAERVDLESLTQYFAVQIYFYNEDWPQNNMTFWRKRTTEFYKDAPRGHDGRWRWMLYDTDFGMNLYGSHNHTQNGIRRVMDGSATDPSSRLLRQLMKNDKFQDHFVNVMADHLNSCFRSSHVHSRINVFNELLAPYRDEHWNRWKSGTDAGQAMKTFATQRPDYMIDHTIDEFNLAGSASLTVSREGGGGQVKVNSIVINNQLPGMSDDSSPYPWDGVYFKGAPLSLKAIDVPGYRFSHWTGIGNSKVTERETSISLTGDLEVKAVFEVAEAVLVHFWHFNHLPDGILGPQSANISETEEPASISYMGDGDGYTDRVSDGTEINGRNGIAAERAFRVRNPSDSRELLLDLPTTGYEEIVMKYAVKRTSNGAQVQDVFFRKEEGGAWTSVRENLQIDEDYQLIEIDFSMVEGVNDNPYFAVKILFPHESASGTSGNNRFDNISLEGYVVRDTSIQQEEENNSGVKIFPIPASDVLHIESKHEILAIDFFDMKGKLIKQERPFSFSHTVAIDNLISGAYFVEIQTLAGSSKQKIMVK